MKPVKINPTHLSAIGCIYSIINTVTGKFYIGSAKHYYDRSYVHTRYLINGKHCNRKLQNAWKKYGEQAFEFEIVEIIDTPTKEKLIEREQLWIDFLKPDYNINKIATSSLGVKRSKETREKCSKSAMGNQNAKGSKRTPEQNLANSERGKGKKLSPETLRKMSLKLRGRKIPRKIVLKAKRTRKRRRGYRKILSNPHIKKQLVDSLAAFLIARLKK